MKLRKKIAAKLEKQANMQAILPPDPLIFDFGFKALQQMTSSQQVQEAEMQKLAQTQQIARQYLQDARFEQQNVNLGQFPMIEDEDALKLQGIICGGYSDQMGQYLSYNDFFQKKEEFSILKGLFEQVQQKYKKKNICVEKTKKRSLLFMVFMEENIKKISCVQIQELFKAHRIVW